jgi:hypothetical protein
MECSETNDAANRSDRHADSHTPTAPADNPLPSPAQSPELTPESKREDKAKRTKVHKREKELFGLVTPIFLPLLEAGETSKDKEKKKRHKKKEPVDGSSPPKQAKSSPLAPSSSGYAQETQAEHGSSSNSSVRMEIESGSKSKEPQTENQCSEPVKKSKRPVIKKSSLRNSGEKRRRKRVSIVIDGQTVLPADQIAEPHLMSPSETTASSASNSTASLEDAIDPRLIGSGIPPFHSPQEAVHHSLDLPARLPTASPTGHTGHTLPEPPHHSPMSQSPPSHAHLEYEPPQITTRTYLESSPTSDPATIPRHASAAPIYADAPKVADAPEEEFSTYVGGISGSGVDDLDQTGSLGYPSSLGASYMESYMQSRPLSVRMAAADKAGMSEAERRRLVNGRESEREEQERRNREEERRLQQRDDDDMDIIGSMEDF